MEKILFAITEMFAAAPGKLLRFKWLVLLFMLAASVFFAIGAVTRTSMDMSMDSFLNEADPAIQALDKFRDQFGSDDSVFLVYRAKDGNIFSRESLEAVQGLTHDLENWTDLNPSDYLAEDSVVSDFSELKHVRRVQSLANIRVQSSEGDTLRSDRLVPKELPDSEAGFAAIRERALAQDDYRLAFFSADGAYGAIMVQTDFGAETADGFVAAVDSTEISLDDSFADFSADASFAVDYDENAQVQEVEFKDVDMLGYVSFFSALEGIYSQYDEQLEFYPVGSAPVMTWINDTMQQMMGLGLGMVLIVGLLLWFLFRSGSAVVWPVLTILLSVLWVWGATAWLGVPISTMVTLTVMLIFAVGIADCVHVMSAYFSNRQRGLAHHEALSLSFRRTGLAILVTTATTMAGISALGVSDILPIKVFAAMSVAGVFMALFFTTFLLPVLLDIWHPGKPVSQPGRTERFAAWWNALPAGVKLGTLAVYSVALFALFGAAIGGYILIVSLITYAVLNWQQSILDVVPGIALRHPVKILAIFGVLFTVCVYGTGQVQIDSNIAELTREGSSVRIAHDTVDEHMAGAQNLEIMIDTNRADGMLNPRLLQAVDELQRRIEATYPDEISRTYSLANIIKDTNRIMHEGDESYAVVPDSQVMIQQLLYLFNSANPEDRRSLVSDDYSRSHITLNAYNAGSYQYQRFFDEISRDVDTIFADVSADYENLDIQLTGSMAVMMRMTDEVAQSQYRSFAIALGVISVILVITLSSIQGGLLSVIPNLLPAMVTFGLMGLLAIPLDTDTLLIAPVIIGIAVDDTIHFMTHYRMTLIRTGSMGEALRSTINDVGKAVMFTSMVLGLSFALLSFSDYLGMAKMGFFGALAIFIALLCDLFLLPALVIMFKPKFGHKDATPDFQLQGETA
ncbi:MAG: MMPL family transporter [Cellvibrionaceae bacterium]